jgi:hypothetical protein
MHKSITILCLLATTVGCTFIARGEDQYRADTRNVLEQRSSEIRACYDNALAQNPAQSGTVVVNFTVEKQSGRLTNVAVDPSGTTAPETLSNCVVNAIDGLVLTPEDRRDGLAEFRWVFRGPEGGAGKPAVASEDDFEDDA